MGDLFEVFPVLFGQEDGVDSGAQRREDFLFDAADGQTMPRRLISPVMATLLRTFVPVRSETSATYIVTSGAWPVFRDRAGWHMNVDVALLEHVESTFSLRRAI
jgi:hypothetical protein